MEQFKRLNNLAQIKVLSDPRRMAVLRLLMAHPATLTQLGEALGEHPARVRHHLKLLEKAGLVDLVDQRVVRGFTEKYYQARARAFAFQQLILPEANEHDTLTLLGSHDLALESLAEQLHAPGSPGRWPSALNLNVVPVGSLEGLIALRQGLAQAAGCHLLDARTGEYNLPFVQHLFPDRPVRLVTLAHRLQGLLVAPGNPKHIHALADLARPDLRMINRNRGSGTRLWLDRQVELGILPSEGVSGYEHEVRTHTAVAEAVQAGGADAGLGLFAAAQKFMLDFVPLFQERFDLVFPADQTLPQLAALLDYISSGPFRRSIEKLGGYETSHTGDELRL